VLAHPVARVVEREVRVYRRLWRGLAFSTFISPVLFLAAMGFGLGDLVDENSGPVGGLDYLDFIAPGLLIASAAQMAAGEGLWPVLAGFKWMRFYHGMMATPMEARHIYGGFVVWSALRSAFSASAFLIVGAVLGAISSWWGLLAVPSAALTAAAFAAPLAAFSATRESDLSFPVILRLVVMPLFLFSGTFFPIQQLPDWLEVAAHVSPLYHGVELARAATTGHYDSSVYAHVAVLAAFVAAGAVAGIRTFSRRLAP
jgi:lipooligosaccharide transport system permease protein